MTLQQDGGTPEKNPYRKAPYQGPPAQAQSGQSKPAKKNSGQGSGVGWPRRTSPRTRFGAPRTGPARWILALAIFAAVMGSSLALKGVLVNYAWFPRASVVVAATLLLPALLRRYSGLSSFAPLGALAGWLLSLTMVFFPTSAVLGFIPTMKTLRAAQLLATEASEVIMGNLAPVPAVLPMVFLVSAGLGFTALLIDTLAITVSMPAASSLGLILVMLPSALMTETGLGTMAFVGAGAGFLLIMGCCRWYAPEGKIRTDSSYLPSGTLTRAVALGAAVVLVMALVPAVLPGFNQGAFPQGTRLNPQNGNVGLDPMISLGENLRQQSGQVHLTYLSNTNSGQYIRLNTLEDFTGKSWRPSPLPLGLQPGLASVAPAHDANPGIPRTETLTVIAPEGLRSEWLPAPAGTVSVTELGGNWRWNPATATIKGAGSTTADQKSYVVRSEVPELTAARLGLATGKPSASLEKVFTTLPDDVPKIVKDTAKSVAGSAATPFAEALALQNYLRSDAFTYSLDTPAEDGYDGSGMEVLAAFLKAKSGYCVHFSAAMAVMARELGIPSRIAVGYAPGAVTTDVAERDGVSLFGYRATGRDAHAWPELYFEGLGWVPFEPTPSRGSVPEYEQETDSSVPLASAAPAPSSTATLTATATESATTAVAAPGNAGQSVNWRHWLLGTGAGILVVLLLMAPGWARNNVRRRRLARVRTPATARVSGPGGAGDTAGTISSGVPPAVLAWRELMDTATDYGYAPDPARTPALHAERIATMLGPTAPAAVGLLRRAYEEDVYGAGASRAGGTQSVDTTSGATAPGSTLSAETAPGAQNPAGRDDLADAVEIVAARLQTRATPWRRLRARWLPASLFHR